MSILLVYASIEGQTKKIAHFIVQMLQDAGQPVELFDANDKVANVDFAGITKAILVAPVHERRHPKSFEVFIKAQARELGAIDTFFLSVSLSAAFPEGHDEAIEYITEMNMRCDFQPGRTMTVAGAVRSTRYDYYASQVIRHIVLKDRELYADDGNHEFTDWDTLSEAISDFVSE